LLLRRAGDAFGCADELRATADATFSYRRGRFGALGEPLASIAEISVSAADVLL
jgi:hypothetical protein